jgi:hypothetical protein
MSIFGSVRNKIIDRMHGDRHKGATVDHVGRSFYFIVSHPSRQGASSQASQEQSLSIRRILHAKVEPAC